MADYRVLINDNGHFMDQSEITDHGVFSSADDAVAECKKIVDKDLDWTSRLGMTAADLYELYVLWGPDPFVVPLDPDDPSVAFSAWTYAKDRCPEVVSARLQ